MSVLKCKECNKKLSEDDRKCPKCGATTEKGAKDNSIIWGVIVGGIVILLLIILAATKSGGENKIVGSWTNEKEFGINMPAPLKYNKLKPTYEGIETTTYIFESNGKCIENIVKTGTETLNGYSKPYNNETTNYYKYKIDNDTLTLIDEEIDEEYEYTIVITDSAVFIDDVKYEKE